MTKYYWNKIDTAALFNDRIPAFLYQLIVKDTLGVMKMDKLTKITSTPDHITLEYTYSIPGKSDDVIVRSRRNLDPFSTRDFMLDERKTLHTKQITKRMILNWKDFLLDESGQVRLDSAIEVQTAQ